MYSRANCKSRCKSMWSELRLKYTYFSVFLCNWIQRTHNSICETCLPDLICIVPGFYLWSPHVCNLTRGYSLYSPNHPGTRRPADLSTLCLLLWVHSVLWRCPTHPTPHHHHHHRTDATESTLMGCVCWCHTHAQWDHTEFDTTSTRLKKSLEVYSPHSPTPALPLSAPRVEEEEEGGRKQRTVTFLQQLTAVKHEHVN